MRPRAAHFHAPGAILAEQRLLIGLLDGGFAQVADLSLDSLTDQELLAVRAGEVMAILLEQNSQPCGNEGVLADVPIRRGGRGESILPCPAGQGQRWGRANLEGGRHSGPVQGRCGSLWRKRQLDFRVLEGSFPRMSIITIAMADEDLAFLREYSKAQGTSAEELLARQARGLRKLLGRPLPPVIVAATGIIKSDVAASDAHQDWLELRHHGANSTRS